MTEESRPRAAPTDPLEDYMKGGSKLSQKYREASGESAPPELDDKILAQARAAVSPRRRRSRPWFTSLALAASLMLAVNLGLHVYRAKPPIEDTGRMSDVFADKDFVPNPPQGKINEPLESNAAAPEPKAAAPQPPASPPPAASPERQARAPSPALKEQAPPALRAMPSSEDDARKQEAADDRLAAAEAERREQGEMARRDAAASAPSAEGGAASAPAPAMAQSESAQAKAKPIALSESQKIDRLIAYIGGLQGAKFIRNGKEYGPEEAASHLRLKRERAGDRVKTADDFIKYCASYSSMSGDAYLIKFADGRTRTAEDVLREELAKMGSG